MRHGYGVRTSAPFGMASRFRPKHAHLRSSSSLRSGSVGPASTTGAGGGGDATAGAAGEAAAGGESTAFTRGSTRSQSGVHGGFSFQWTPEGSTRSSPGVHIRICIP